MSHYIKLFIFLIIGLGTNSPVVMAENDSNTVFVFEIADEIAEPIWHNFKVAIHQAKQNN
ncbi:MAG: hypothetical protein ACJAWO_001394, partial [Halieaceae bacterium]